MKGHTSLIHLETTHLLCRRIESTSGASWIGLIATAIWAVATIILVTAAGLKGVLRPLYLLPDWSLLGADPISIATNIVAIIPILATAFTNQMQVHFVVSRGQNRCWCMVDGCRATSGALCSACCQGLPSLSVSGGKVPVQGKKTKALT